MSQKAIIAVLASVLVVVLAGASGYIVYQAGRNSVLNQNSSSSSSNVISSSGSTTSSVVSSSVISSSSTGSSNGLMTYSNPETAGIVFQYDSGWSTPVVTQDGDFTAGSPGSATKTISMTKQGNNLKIVLTYKVNNSGGPIPECYPDANLIPIADWYRVKQLNFNPNVEFFYVKRSDVVSNSSCKNLVTSPQTVSAKDWMWISITTSAAADANFALVDSVVRTIVY